MYTCDVCSKSFKRRDNMIRHMKNIHGEDSEDSDVTPGSDSDSERSDTIYEDEVGRQDSEGNQNERSDSEDSTESNDDERMEWSVYDGPWDVIVEQAFDECQTAFEEEVTALIENNKMAEEQARFKVYQSMKSAYRKAIMNLFTARITWFRSIRRDHIFKAIRKTAISLKDVDEYDDDEAWKYAISKRKYLFDNLLKEYNPPSLQNEGSESEEGSEMEENDEDSSRKRKCSDDDDDGGGGGDGSGGDLLPKKKLKMMYSDYR